MPGISGLIGNSRCLEILNFQPNAYNKPISQVQAVFIFSLFLNERNLICFFLHVLY